MLLQSKESFHFFKGPFSNYFLVILACDCKGANKICNSLTGMCNCPPNTQGRVCDPCQCNSNSNKCSRDGICSRCEFNTEGDNCEKCQDGFYGDALKSQCTGKFLLTVGVMKFFNLRDFRWEEILLVAIFQNVSLPINLLILVFHHNLLHLVYKSKKKSKKKKKNQSSCFLKF